MKQRSRIRRRHAVLVAAASPARTTTKPMAKQSKQQLLVNR